MATPARHGQLKHLLTYLLTTLFAINVQCELDGSSQHPIGPESTRHYPDLPVLGYVTPWNSRGNGLVEEHREKFDIVSPVWYTIHTNEGAGDDMYTVRGGPPSEEDEQWYKRLQQPLDTEGQSSRTLQITPRFFLDGWKPEDYKGLVLNGTRWQMLSDIIMDVVRDMSYDGIVFESGGSYALGPPLTTVSHALHDEDKILILVMPPVRRSDDERTSIHNNMILKPLAGLAHYVDYFSVMTYDMTGPGGRQALDAEGLPEDGPIRKAIAQGQVREPGPNTSADWVRDNLVTFVEGSSSQAGMSVEQMQFAAFMEAASSAVRGVPRKFLMGVPQYGYRYPVMFIDRKTGDVDEEPLRGAGGGGAGGSGGGAGAAPLPVLAGAGEPVTTVEIKDILDGSGIQLSKTEEGEYFFDYLSAPDQGHFRVFLPTSESMSQVLDTIQEVVDDELMYSFGGAGVALWDVGQSSDELLATL